MANDPVKQLLVKLGISTTDWKRAVQDIKGQLQSINDQAKADFAQKQAQAKQELDLTKNQIAAEQRLQAEAKATAEIEKSKIAFHQAQAAAMKEKVAASAAEAAQAKSIGAIAAANATIDKAAAATKIAAIAAQNAEIKKQQVEQTTQLAIQRQQIALEAQKLRLQQQQTRAQAGAGGGTGGMMRSMMGGVANMFGGGLAGGLATGVLVGGGITAMIEASMASIEKLVEKLKEIVKSDGPLMQLEGQFQKLGKAAGIDTEKYFEQLSTATLGLVNKTDLLRLANQFLQSGMKVSTEDMLKMTQATVALARGQGKDAEQAVTSLSRAMLTGRFNTLSLVTGIQRADLQLRGLSTSASSSERATAQFNLVLGSLETRLKQVGEPALTFTERLKQLEVAKTIFFQDMAQGFVSSPGLQKFMDMLGGIVTQLHNAHDWGLKVGNALGQMFGAFMVTGREVFKLIGDITGGLLHMLPEGKADKSDWLTNTQSRLTSIRGLIFTFYNIWLTFDKQVRYTGMYWEALVSKISHVGKTLVTKPWKAGDVAGQEESKFEANVAALQADTDKKGQAMVDMLNGQSTGLNLGGAGTGGGEGNTTNIQAAQKRAQLMLGLKQAQAKQELEIVKERVEKEKILNDQAFSDGKKSIEDYIKTRKVEETEIYAAKVKEIELEKQAQLAEVGSKVTGGGLTKSEAGIKRQTIETDTNTKLLAARADYISKLGALDKQQDDDVQASAKTREDAELKITQEGIEKRKSLLEASFKAGDVDADEYMQRRKELAQEDYQATIDQLSAKFAYEKNTNESLAKLTEDYVSAYKAYQKEINGIDDNAYQTRLTAAERYYKSLDAYLQSSLQASKTPGSVSGKGVNSAITAMISAEESAIAEYKRQLSDIGTSPGSPQIQNQQWLDINTKINDANVKLQEYYKLLNQSKDIMTPMASIFGAISSGFGFVSSGIGRTLGPVSSTFSALGQMQQQSGADNNPFSKLGDTFSNLFDSSDKASLGSKMGDFSKALDPAIKAVGGFAQSILGAKDAVSGAVGGGTSGAGLGQALSAGSSFGPWGAAIGAVAGGILGGIMGAKAKQVQDEVTNFNQQMKNIAQSMQDGATKMGDAITQMKTVEADAIATLGHSKKGQQQLPQLIDQYNQQIQQLIEQQKTLLDQLRQQNEILEAPQAFQGYLNSLDSIIQKYEQFSSAAAGNATAVAQANQFLALSLQQYAQTQSDQLNTAEQDAINNALTLNNLLTQRQQLLTSTANQEESILGQGVLSRTSTASTKAQQMADLMTNEQNQMDVLNQQIDVAQYRFNIEQQIFGLTSDSTTLQMQLVALQEQQVKEQTDQISALQTLVKDLQSGDLASMLAGADPSTVMDILLAFMGFSTIPNFSPTVPTLSPGVPIGTNPPGNYQPGQTGNAPIYPSYGAGGYIAYDQLAQVHKGEVVLNTDQVDAYLGKSSSMGLGSEVQMHAMASSRIAAESALLQAKASQTKLDMMHLDKLNLLINNLKNSGLNSSGSLENMLMALYGTRGRYGAGGFTRESL